jgi:hypothetical protein
LIFSKIIQALKEKKMYSAQRRYVCYPDELKRQYAEHTVAGTRKKDKEKSKGILASIAPLLWLIFIVFALLWLYYYLKKMQTSNRGKVIIAVASSQPRSAAPFRAGNNLTKAMAAIDHIQVLQSGPGKGWQNISNTHQTVDLLALRNPSSKAQIIADTQLPVGQYQKIKFYISKVMVEDPQGAKVVYLPGNTVEFDAPFSVMAKKDTATVIVLDLSLDESLRDAVDEAGRPVKIFAPVIHYENRGDSQVTTTNKKLTFQKTGVLQHQGTIGMDANGNVEKGVGIPFGTALKIDKGKVVQQDGSSSSSSVVKTRTHTLPQDMQDNNGGPLISSLGTGGSNVTVEIEGSGNGQWKALPAMYHGKYNRYNHK